MSGKTYKRVSLDSKMGNGRTVRQEMALIDENFAESLDEEEKDGSLKDVPGWHVIQVNDKPKRNAKDSKESVENPGEVSATFKTKFKYSLPISVGTQFTIIRNGIKVKYHIIDAKAIKATKLGRQKSSESHVRLISEKSRLATQVMGLRAGAIVDNELSLPKDKKHSKIEIIEVKEAYLVPIGGETTPDTEGLTFGKREGKKKDLEDKGGELEL